MCVRAAGLTIYLLQFYAFENFLQSHDPEAPFEAILRWALLSGAEMGTSNLDTNHKEYVWKWEITKKATTKGEKKAKH